MADDRAYARHDLGVCTLVEPEFVGSPGSRMFRLYATGENGSALLWLEKEELYELALTIKRLLRSAVRETGEPVVSGSRNTRVDFDCKVTALSLGHDRRTGRYMILAQVSEEEDDAIALWADSDVMNWLADRAFEVHDAGRARCFLCGAPMREGKSHACPRAN